MTGLLRGLRPLLDCLLLPAAALSLFALMALAALWYYMSTMTYLVGRLPRLFVAAEPAGHARNAPHFSDRPVRSVEER
jgi:hypothetical protein